MNNLANIKIGRKLGLLVGVNIFLLACVAGIALWGLHQIDVMSDMAILEGHKATLGTKISADVTQAGLGIASLLIEKQSGNRGERFGAA
jgi:hypothetical protein